MVLALIVGGGCTRLLGVDEPRPTPPDGGGGGDAATPPEGSVSACLGLAEDHVQCGTRCVDPLRDSFHCGRCGHSCLGGRCIDGRCEVVRLAEDYDIIVSLERLGGDLYYLAALEAGGRRLFHVPIHGDGGLTHQCQGADLRCQIASPIPAPPAAGTLGTPGRLVAAGDRLVVTYGTDLYEYTPLGGQWAFRVTAEVAPSFLAASPSEVFWSSIATSYAFGHKPGQSPRRRGSAADAVTPWFLAVGEASRSLFVAVESSQGSVSRGFHRLPLDEAECGGDACRLGPAREPQGLAIFAGWLYTAALNDTRTAVRVERQPEGGCADASTCAELVLEAVFSSAAAGVLVDATGVYWPQARESEGTRHPVEIRRLPLDTSCIEVPGQPCGEAVLEGLRSLSRWVQDDAALYAVVEEDALEGPHIVRVIK